MPLIVYSMLQNRNRINGTIKG
jgi:hypothetical protein